MSGTMALNATTMTIGVTSSQARLFLRLLMIVLGGARDSREAPAVLVEPDPLRQEADAAGVAAGDRGVALEPDLDQVLAEPGGDDAEPAVILDEEIGRAHV